MGWVVYKGDCEEESEKMSARFQKRRRARQRKRGPWKGFTPRAATAGFQRTAGFYGRFRQGGDELKFHDLDIDDANIATGGTIAQSSVNLIAQGVTEVQRVGRKCVMRSINWRFTIQKDSVANGTTASDTVRVILYHDKQTNGAAAVSTDILESADYQSFNNLANKSRFRTLMDRTYAMNASAGSGRGATDTVDYAETRLDETFYKTVNIPLEFDAATGALTEIRSNNVGVLLLSADGRCSFASKMRVRFSD